MIDTERQTRMLTRTSTQSLTEQLADRFAERIRNRLLAPGARLPSVRECARQQGVSPHTVVAAYDQLLAQGLVEARRQQGFYVRDSAVAIGGAASPSMTCVAQQPLGADGGGRCQHADPRHVPSPERQAAARHGRLSARLAGVDLHARRGAPRDQHQGAAGVLAAVRRARRATADCAAASPPSWRSINVPAGPEQIVTTVGATHALDIVSRTLLRPAIR